ncbi:autotransporter adhesin BpaC-like [Gadus chalcogrammus]|uniref:autotransporter adhesin BpaC-like n=1 Tax=Gadus chalcogrammus TaxID=1042646 RepID=UPI0024C4BAA7|nr:autotransporter adhesin BpaC-like [Gadus chalcogrammus]
MGWSVLFSLLLALTIYRHDELYSSWINRQYRNDGLYSSWINRQYPNYELCSSWINRQYRHDELYSSWINRQYRHDELYSSWINRQYAMMGSTAAGSTASTAMMGSTAAGSTASTPIMNSVAAGSTASTAMMSSTAAGSTASTAMMSSTAAGSTASTAMVSSTAAGSTASTAMMSSTAAGSTASTTMSPISNAGCGISLLCAGAPESCDPSKPGSCFFVGIKRTAGQNFEFSLSGESKGYIGCTLSTDSSLGGGDITFICANNKGTLKFIGASLDNGALSRQTVNASSVKGHINGTTIQCTFKATVPDTTARGSATSFALAVVSGTFSPGTGDLGAPEAKVQTKVLDIADTNSITSSILNSGRPTNQALSEALLIIIVTMGLAAHI